MRESGRIAYAEVVVRIRCTWLPASVAPSLLLMKCSIAGMVTKLRIHVAIPVEDSCREIPALRRLKKTISDMRSHPRPEVQIGMKIRARTLARPDRYDERATHTHTKNPAHTIEYTRAHIHIHTRTHTHARNQNGMKTAPYTQTSYNILCCISKLRKRRLQFPRPQWGAGVLVGSYKEKYKISGKYIFLIFCNFPDPINYTKNMFFL